MLTDEELEVLCIVREKKCNGLSNPLDERRVHVVRLMNRGYVKVTCSPVLASLSLTDKGMSILECKK